MQVYQRFDVDVMPPPWNFVKNKTPPKSFSCEFCKMFKKTYFVASLRTTASNL